MIKSTIAALGALGCLCIGISAVQAGGEMGDSKHKDEGTRFFGFVRDQNGKPLPEAKVVAEIKNSTRYITHTGKNGMYSFGGFAKSVKPDDLLTVVANLAGQGGRACEVGVRIRGSR